MVKSNKSNLKEDERLAKQVRKFPYVYDKRDESYQEKSRKKNLRSAVKNAFGREEGTQSKLFLPLFI